MRAADLFSPLAGAGLAQAERRLSLLRWGMLTLAVALLVSAWALSLSVAWLPLCQTLATLALGNLLLAWCRRCDAAPRMLLRTGLCLDVLVLSELLAFSGGAANPLSSLYLPPVLFAALLSPGAFAWGLALLSAAIYGLLFFWHLPWPLADGDAAAAFHTHQLGMWFSFALSSILMAGFVSHLAHQLSARERELAGAREHQLRDEQLVAIGMQAAMAAHALSTPLNTLTLMVDEWRELRPAGVPGDELDIMQSQLALCRDALTRLKHQAQTGAQPVELFASLSERLAGWRALRPDVTLEWHPPGAPDPRVALDAAFWPALFNLINNAAEAGGGQVSVAAAYRPGWLTLDIVNREGCLSAAQLQAAGLAQLPSAKVAGLGLGVLLSHATLARLGGSLTLDNRPQGGVHARIALPVGEET